jgi:hypothetical protein
MISRFRTLSVLAILVLVVARDGLSAQAPSHKGSPSTDPLVGTWVLNVAKSKWESGTPVKGEIRTIDHSFDGMFLVARTRHEANGTTTVGHWVCKMDDQFYPEFSRALGTTPVAWLAFKRTDPHNVQIRVRHDGVVDGSGSFSVSPDGKVLTYVLKGKGSQGQPTNTLRVYEKQ